MSEIEALTIEWSIAHDEYTPLYARMNTERHWALPKEDQDKEYAEFKVPHKRYEELTQQLVKMENSKSTELEKLISFWVKAVLLHWKWCDTCSGYRFDCYPIEDGKKLHAAYVAREEAEEKLLEACRKVR